MPVNTSQRIEAISKQLRESPNPPSTATIMSADKRPPITCHVLDTTIGKPAANIPVTLTLYSTTSASAPSPSTSPVKFSATTNSDGRVTSWTPSGPFASQTLEEVYNLDGDHKWSLLFDTDEYFEGRAKTFFPEVEVKFRIRQEAKGEHYHVPVLLGPFGYTTYRGS